MATSIHPRALRDLDLVGAPRVLEGRLAAAAWPPLDLLTGVVGGGVLACAVTIATLVGVTDLSPRGAALVTALAVGAGLAAVPIRTALRARSHGRRDRAVDARTATELDRLAGRRWRVRHDVPLDDGRAAHLVADDHGIHLVVVVWVAGGGGPLHLRAAVAAACRASRRLAQVDADAGRARPVSAAVVAWGPQAADARDRQAPGSTVEVLLPGELWTWRAARNGRPASDAA